MMKASILTPLDVTELKRYHARENWRAFSVRFHEAGGVIDSPEYRAAKEFFDRQISCQLRMQSERTVRARGSVRTHIIFPSAVLNQEINIESKSDFVDAQTSNVAITSWRVPELSKA